MAKTSLLRRRMIEDMTVCNLSPATQRSFVHAASPLPSLKARTPLTTAYAAGLRVSEVTGLRVADIVPEARLRHDDSGRMMIRIEHGKGGKERCVMLSAQLLAILRTYWRRARPEHRLFRGRDATRPIEPTTPHAACRSARAAAGIGKKVTVHIPRHSFAVALANKNARIVWSVLAVEQDYRPENAVAVS